jgi:hypothetical protein
MSYTDNGDGTVTDNSTGLMWEKKSHQSGDVHDMSYVYSWSTREHVGEKDGTAFTTFLNLLNAGIGFANHTNWRLPTVKEFLTIVDRSRGSLPAIDPIFGPTQSEYYWSDDTLPPPAHNYAQIAFTVNFGVLSETPANYRPQIYTSNKVRENYVRAVRAPGGPPP